MENEKLELEEQLDNFVNSNDVVTFENGKYTDKMRMVYEDLMCMGIGSRNVEEVIRTVLKKLANKECGRLPKTTFGKYILLEARGLAQLHVASVCKTGWEERSQTLQSDGTSKHGRKYITYDIIGDDGKTLVVGLREVGGGDAETQLHALKEVLADVRETSESGSGEEGCTKRFMSIKNLMSDRGSTQKKFNEIFIQYRNDILPTILGNWNLLEASEQQKLL